MRCSMLMAAHCDLRASALLALTKLMVVERELCDANLRLLFTLLAKGCARARRTTPPPPPPAMCSSPTLGHRGCYLLKGTPRHNFAVSLSKPEMLSASAANLSWGLLL